MWQSPMSQATTLGRSRPQRRSSSAKLRPCAARVRSCPCVCRTDRRGGRTRRSAVRGGSARPRRSPQIRRVGRAKTSTTGDPHRLSGSRTSRSTSTSCAVPLAVVDVSRPASRGISAALARYHVSRLLQVWRARHGGQRDRDDDVLFLLRGHTSGPARQGAT